MPVFEQHAGKPPPEPHLALLHDDGEATAIPVGATLFIVEDPTRADKVFPLVLAKVSRKALVFVCACGNSDCDRNLRFVCNVRGWHHPKKRHLAGAPSLEEGDAASAPSTPTPSDPSSGSDQ